MKNRSELPGIAEDGFLDPAQSPIDPVLKQALSDDRQEFESAVSILRCMYNYQRPEAGVFLIGLLLTCGDNWEKRRALATALYDVQTKECANVLFGELKRVKNTNSTRRYHHHQNDAIFLTGIPDVESSLPHA